MNSLYLDTARLGCISPTASLLQQGFVRLAAEEPCSLYTQQFLHDGISAVPEFQEQFPQLFLWNGISDLKQQVAQQLAGHTDSDRVLVSSRTKSLMELGAMLLTRRCQRVLVTDLIWPPYLRLLRRFANQSDTEICFVSVRERLFTGKLSPVDLVNLLSNRFEHKQCDGLFLPLVSHTGIRLPVEMLVEQLRQRSQLGCTVVDASQAFGHVDTKFVTSLADFTIGGVHKWVSAYLPLGIGLVGNETTAHALRDLLTESVVDPLLSMLESAKSPAIKDARETVNVSPLLTCRGAVEDLHFQQKSSQEQQQQNRDLTQDVLQRHGWRPLVPPQSLQSGILLAQSEKRVYRYVRSEDIRSVFRDRGLSVTTYPGGFVRISLPFERFTNSAADRLESALHNFSNPAGRRRTVLQLVAVRAREWLGELPSRRFVAADLQHAGC